MTDALEAPADAGGHDKPVCGGERRSGGRCTRPAGWGTPHPGIGKCKLHGGSTPNHVASAQREVARREAAKFTDLRDIDPHTALLEEVQRTAARVAYYGMRLAKDDKTVTEGDGWLVEQEQRERRHLVAASKAAIEGGVDVRRVELEQARVALQVRGITAGMDAVSMPQPDREVFLRAMLSQLRVEGSEDE